MYQFNLCCALCINQDKLQLESMLNFQLISKDTVLTKPWVLYTERPKQMVLMEFLVNFIASFAFHVQSGHAGCISIIYDTNCFSWVLISCLFVN